MKKHDRYSIKEFNRQFPNDAACLDFIWAKKFPQGVTCPKCSKADRYSRVTTRKCYSCECGHQISPCEGTVFHKSSTSLHSWFFALYLMMSSKNGVSAKEIERQTGVTYKTAWRMGHQLRKLMNSDKDMLSGTVEIDETIVGGFRKGDKGRTVKGNKAVVFGMMERNGDVVASIVRDASKKSLVPLIETTVEKGAMVNTDMWNSYQDLSKIGYNHATVNHGAGEYVRATIHTNSIEGFWSQLKRSIHGTFHQVGRDQLQAYVDEFAFRYNHRASVTEAPIFPVLVARVGERREQVA